VDHRHVHTREKRVHTEHRAVRHQLELRVDADPFWMSSLRALITDLAIRADFDLDAVADFTQAVDEACAVLIGAAAPQDTLVCRFAVAADRITVTAMLPTEWHAEYPGLAADTFGWRVMCTLADDVELMTDGMLGIVLTKLRTVDAGG
jgi:serine/threonine-protein kinase RsbW